MRRKHPYWRWVILLVSVLLVTNGNVILHWIDLSMSNHQPLFLLAAGGQLLVTGTLCFVCPLLGIKAEEARKRQEQTRRREEDVP